MSEGRMDEGNSVMERAAWASSCGEDEYGEWVIARVGSVDVKFRYCSPGRFLMGSPRSERGHWDDEGPQHEVELPRGVWMGETPVTQRVWEAVMGGNPSRFMGPERPVERVSWEECMGFVGKVNARCPGLGVRLPTEAEWEYACRAGTTGPTYRGKNDAVTLDAIAWYPKNSGRETHPVRQKAPNAWGLYDMLGNVWEWCADWKVDYMATRQVDPTGPHQGTLRVSRGSSWGTVARRMRAAARFGATPETRRDDVGFRLARGQ